MDVVVILEFRQGEEVHPVVLSLIDEYPKVLGQLRAAGPNLAGDPKLDIFTE